MKKFILSIFTLVLIFTFGISNSSASAAVEHDWYDRLEYKSEPRYDEVVYQGTKKVTCTVSEWFVRSVQKCHLHPGETNTSMWSGIGLRHSHAH